MIVFFFYMKKFDSYVMNGKIYIYIFFVKFWSHLFVPKMLMTNSILDGISFLCWWYAIDTEKFSIFLRSKGHVRKTIIQKIRGDDKGRGENCKRFRNESVVMTTLLIRFTSHHFHPPPSYFHHLFYHFFKHVVYFRNILFLAKEFLRALYKVTVLIPYFSMQFYFPWDGNGDILGCIKFPLEGGHEVFRDGRRGRSKMFLIPERRSD